ncbi:hypothetical protein SK128_026748 [Halocaridina rubra]|uniref:C2H2-type domain-containing protein n=1 Tax=Halocaridina rubra TaxID=373956 RepID=A0AAN8ZSP1_HALRR
MHFQQMRTHYDEAARGTPWLSVPSDNPYQCLYCSYKCSTESKLTRHMNKHTGEKLYGCPYCPYRAAQAKTLTFHVRGHTGEKPYSCDLCPYRAVRMDSLKLHIFNRHEKIQKL